MAETPQVLLSGPEITARVEALAALIAPAIDDDTVCICILTGGIWFAADLTRALHAAGRDPLFDCLWLTSYGEAKASSGRCEMLAGPGRDLHGRTVLLIDDVIDSGLSLAEAKRIVQRLGAVRVLSAVFAKKPWNETRAVEPDFAAWDAPAEFLVGYGMDDAGRGRAQMEVRGAKV